MFFVYLSSHCRLDIHTLDYHPSHQCARRRCQRWCGFARRRRRAWTRVALRNCRKGRHRMKLDERVKCLRALHQGAKTSPLQRARLRDTIVHVEARDGWPVRKISGRGRPHRLEPVPDPAEKTARRRLHRMYRRRHREMGSLEAVSGRAPRRMPARRTPPVAVRA